MSTAMTFFLIDDDEDDRELFDIALDGLEQRPLYYSAPNGIKALNMLEAKEVIPDYIFLDLNMPQMSGRDCLIALKNNTELSKIPVVIFSTSSDGRDISETRELGAIHFITKPPKTSELTRILSNFILKQKEL